MAQEQEYKYPNVCGPQAPWSGEAGRPRTRHTPSEGSALGACLPACLGRTAAPRAPTRGAAEVSPAHAESQRDSQFSGTTLGERIREGRKDGQGGRGPRQARLGRALQQELRQPPSNPLLRLCLPRELGGVPWLKAAGGEPPGRAQPPRGFKRSGQHWGWKGTDRSWGTEKQHKAINNRIQICEGPGRPHIFWGRGTPHSPQLRAGTAPGHSLPRTPGRAFYFPLSTRQVQHPTSGHT